MLLLVHADQYSLCTAWCVALVCKRVSRLLHAAVHGLMEQLSCCSDRDYWCHHCSFGVQRSMSPPLPALLLLLA
jgi:hypothetical protein